MKSSLPILGLVAALLISSAPARSAASAPSIDAAAASRFADLALKCVHQEYPNKISHTLAGDADVRPPRELFPAFHGCYDWHSAVHGHWLLARLVRQFPDAAFAARCAGRARAKPHPGKHCGRGGLSTAARPRVVRAALWTRLAAAAIRRVALLERPPSAGVGSQSRAARDAKPPRASNAGCRICTTRFASANTIRPPFRSV